MARIKILDIPADKKITSKEMKTIPGGFIRKINIDQESQKDFTPEINKFFVDNHNPINNKIK